MEENAEGINSFISYTTRSYSVYLKLMGTRNKSINSKRDKRKRGEKVKWKGRGLSMRADKLFQLFFYSSDLKDKLEFIS